ncbi:MAG: [FeFe] hydrogenase H-cluster radical SAM maturase HydE, partial [Candidatus Omnitrophota bacterium]|nr:[FeFe] hydrogenase H-cluster radical SAM maturase HydE [Candidatus Omnitrophota bacterium]
MKKEEIVKYLKAGKISGLFKKADAARKLYCGDKIFIRGIIEFSNFCVRDCLYCGLRKSNKKLKRYRMKIPEIRALSFRIIEKGIKTIVLQSGDDFFYTKDTLCKLISGIKKRCPDIAVTLSLGERPLDDYKAFKAAGADRYLLKHETANSSLYSKLHPRQELKTRLKILKHLRKLGYQVGAGNIVGLPFQSPEDLADDILFMRNLDVDMAGIGPFIPQKDTPLRGYPSGSLDLTLKVLALTRIAVKDTHLPATTALAALNPGAGQLLGFQAGANVIMP